MEAAETVYAQQAVARDGVPPRVNSAVRRRARRKTAEHPRVHGDHRVKAP